jgi:hypothetical protein
MSKIIPHIAICNDAVQQYTKGFGRDFYSGFPSPHEPPLSAMPVGLAGSAIWVLPLGHPDYQPMPECKRCAALRYLI